MWCASHSLVVMVTTVVAECVCESYVLRQKKQLSLKDGCLGYWVCPV